jgi:hypothetical protein
MQTEERYALTIALGSPFEPYITTLMYTTHSHLMIMVDYYHRNGYRIVSVETLESAIRADALVRGLW